MKQIEVFFSKKKTNKTTILKIKLKIKISSFAFFNYNNRSLRN